MTTRYGGGFVQSIDGLAGRPAAAAQRLVLLRERRRGLRPARPTCTLSPGDVVQWDYRAGTRRRTCPAIVGAFPEPFLHGQRASATRRASSARSDRARRATTVQRRARRRRRPDRLRASLGVRRLAAGAARDRRHRGPRCASCRSRGRAREGPAAASGVYARFDASRAHAHAARRSRARRADGAARHRAGRGDHAGRQQPLWVVTGRRRGGRGACRAALDAGDAAQRVRGRRHARAVRSACRWRRVSSLSFAPDLPPPAASALHSARAGAAAAFCCALGARAGALPAPARARGAPAPGSRRGAPRRGSATGAARARCCSGCRSRSSSRSVNPLVSQSGHTVLVRGGDAPRARASTSRSRRSLFGLVAALRVLVLIAAFGLFNAVVDPDELLRLVRRFSYRSALTASLATRLVPVLARDATPHERGGALPAAPAGAARAVARAALAGCARARRRRGGGARAARLRRRARPARRARGRGRGTTCAWRARRVASLALVVVGDARAGRRRVRARTRRRRCRSGPAELALVAGAAAAGGALPFAGARRAAGGGAWLSRSCARAASATAIPSAPRPRSSDVTLELAPGSFTVLAGRVGVGQVDAAARRQRPRAALPRRRGMGRAGGRRA